MSESVKSKGGMSWEKIKLGDIVKMVTGKTPPTSNLDYFDGDFLWVNPSDFGSKYIIESKRTISQKAIDEKKCNLLPKGTILLSCIGDIGKIGILKTQGTSNQQITGLIAKENVFPDYLFYYLIHNKSKLESLANKAVVAILNNERLRDLDVILPPLPIQKRIAEILDAADALKRKDQQLLKKYDELAQAIFIDMFGDPVKNEKGWEVKTIGEFGKVSTGNTPSRAVSENYNSNYIEWIKTDNIEERSLYVTSANEYLSENGLKKGRTTVNGSLLVACIAGSIDSIGRAALTDRSVAFNQQINSIEPNEKVNSFFLYYLFKYCRKHIQNHASNGMKRMLSKGEFEKIKMILPDLDFQLEFKKKINKLIIQNEKIKIAFDKSDFLFQTLLQKAFKGELVN